jgi:hypothetical protein
MSAQERVILVMKQQQDIENSQAQGLLALVKNAPGPSADIGTRISVYA